MTKNLGNQEIQRYQELVKRVIDWLPSSHYWKNLPIEKEDLYQIGWISLTKALDKFDKNRGVKFETFASKVIFHDIAKELNKLSRRRITLTNQQAILDFKIQKQSRLLDKLFNAIEFSDKFTTNEKQALWCRLEGKSFAKIGKELGISKETARTTYNATINRVRGLLVNEI